MTTDTSARRRPLTPGRVGALVALGLTALALSLAANQTSGSLWDSHAQPVHDLYYTFLVVAPVAWFFSLIAGLARRRRSPNARPLTQLGLLVSTPWAAFVVWVLVWGMGERTGTQAPKGLAALDCLFAATVLFIGWLIEDALGRTPKNS